MMLIQLLTDFGDHLELLDEAFDIWLDRRFIKTIGGLTQCPIPAQKIEQFAQKYQIHIDDAANLFIELDVMDGHLAEKYCELLDLLRSGAADAEMSLHDYWKEYSAGFEFGHGPGHA